MLISLTIRNIALMDEMQVEFSSGLHVLTGETGAGKSILVDAISLLLGGRAPKELIRKGEDRARVDFSQPDRFERVLALESRRLRKVGCLVVISARLNSAIVDVLIRMHHMGPAVRLYLITFAPEDGNVLPLISRLQQDGMEVAYVKPEKAAE